MFETLTDRKRDLLLLVAQGLNRRALTDRLFISKRTVDKHLGNLSTKLGLESRAERMLFRFGEGFVPLPYVAPEVRDGEERSSRYG